MMFGLTDAQLVALTLYGECRGEGLLGQLAVASVIRTRLHSGRWGRTYSTVVFAPKQFSAWNEDDDNLPLLRTLSQELSSGQVRDDAALRRCLWIADGTVRSCFDSVVADATHYFAISTKHAPAWAATGEYVDHIGGHIFFRNVK